MELLLPAQRQKLPLRSPHLLSAPAVNDLTSSACFSPRTIFSHVPCLRGEFLYPRLRRSGRPFESIPLSESQLAGWERNSRFFMGLVFSLSRRGRI